MYVCMYVMYVTYVCTFVYLYVGTCYVTLSGRQAGGGRREGGMHGGLDGWTHGRMYVCRMCVCTFARMYVCMHGGRHAGLDGRMHGCMDGCMD